MAGISDSWWDDGFVAHVLVQHDDAEGVANEFGRAARWWPRAMEPVPSEWWLRFPRHGEELEQAMRRIRAYVAREPDSAWVQVSLARSNSEPWADDDDYHRPLYENAVAACSHSVPEESGIFEAPVATAIALSERFETHALALWGSDEEPALGGIALIGSGSYVWSASVCSRENLAGAFSRYTSGEESGEDDWDESAGYERFHLYREGTEAEKGAGNLREWADQEWRALGGRLNLGLDPRSVLPFDFPDPMQDMVAELVVAVDAL